MTVSTDYDLTRAFLRTLYTLEEPAGILRHKRRPVWMFINGGHSAEHNCNVWNVRYAEKIAGRVNDGYIQTTIKLPDGRWIRVKVHNIIWCMRTGRWPTREIDHRNGNKLDNSQGNLRLASHSQQMENRGRHCNNTSGITGVSYHKRYSKWQSYIKKDDKLIQLYWGDSFEAAVAARKAGELKYFGKYRREA